MTEKQIEAKFKKCCDERGWKCLKYTSPYYAGIPDRIVLMPNNIVYFVEVKTETGKLSPLQERAQGMLLAYPQRYLLLRGEAGIGECIREMEKTLRESR